MRSVTATDVYASEALSAEDIAFFKENGFTRPFKVYEPEEAVEIGRMIARKGRVRKTAVYGEECTANYDRHLDIDELAAHVTKPQIVRRLQSLMGPDLLCWRSEFFTKYPGDPGTEWHQVEVYRYSTGQPQLQPTDPEAELFQLTCWTAFTPATLANGCMKLLPGSHRYWFYDEAKDVKRPGLFDAKKISKMSSFWGYDYADFKIDPGWSPDESNAYPMQMSAGQAFIFTAKCVHGSLPNTTKDMVRFSFGARYVPTHVKLYPGVTEFVEHGSKFDLKNYGAVLVSGNDRYGHNPLKERTLLDRPYASPLPGW